MIRVTIERRGSQFKEEMFTDICNVTEAIAGSVFEEEQSSIDVICPEPFGIFDIREDDLFITVEIDEKDIHHDLKVLTEQFTTQVDNFLTQQFSQHVPFRVWVQRIAGEFKEVWTNKTKR
jgi:hypothetical protein